MVEVLAEDRPDDLVAAWQALEAYPKVRKRVEKALTSLSESAAAGLGRIL